jgi:hypothetical protein
MERVMARVFAVLIVALLIGNHQLSAAPAGMLTREKRRDQ